MMTSTVAHGEVTTWPVFTGQVVDDDRVVYIDVVRSGRFGAGTVPATSNESWPLDETVTRDPSTDSAAVTMRLVTGERTSLQSAKEVYVSQPPPGRLLATLVSGAPLLPTQDLVVREFAESVAGVAHSANVAVLAKWLRSGSIGANSISRAVGFARELRQAYLRRVEELRAFGAEEGIGIRSESEQDFWAFIESSPAARKASLVLTDDGNLRAVWKDDAGNRLGLQFLGGRTVQYVIFSRLSGADNISRAAGETTLTEVRTLINNFQLNTVVYG